MYWFLVWFGGGGIFLSLIEVTIHNDIKTAFNRKNEDSYNDNVH